ncbi:hypothetical protein [Blastochloris sulfoviridis]|uniref:Uncharacterized protein n=1 Tax=Blastochloris sulfoviridis TaxID=50712 RepID=A0A5M6HHR9_9HYPH|nr:hypothetical protein [Blastochloris sulfoviridis]KAA5595410.1 hypothetical protein F1193_16620 [Blastochloris sulfoviridis]
MTSPKPVDVSLEPENAMTAPQLHRRAFMFGVLATGAAAIAVGSSRAEAAPFLSASPANSDAAAGPFDAVFRPNQDNVAAETVQWSNRCWIDARSGRRVCVQRRWVCRWHKGRRVCGWRDHY